MESRSDTKTFDLAPGRGVEFKLYVESGDALHYKWTSPRPLFFEFHGDREGDASGAFTSHKKSTLAEDEADFTAPFTGRHGWYWENRNRADVTITLETSGTYAVVGITG